jgi:predicted DCC family thiol-disulfide oxidoreductase YuxK
MGGGWALLSLLMGIFPSGLRDFFYDAFAERRYRWFGKKESCTIPSKEDRQRFLP